MIRFLLWTAAASALSSILLFPLAWRAVLVGLATAWAVLWAERVWARVESTPCRRAVVFAICGLVTGLAGGLAILAVGAFLKDCGVHWIGGVGPSPWTLPAETVLCVLGVGWCHLNRNCVRAGILMLLALAVASWLRRTVLPLEISSDANTDYGGVVMCFLLGSVPFALLWLGAARIANRDRMPPGKRRR